MVAGLLYDSRLDNDDFTRQALLSFLVSVAAVPNEFEWVMDELKTTAAFDLTPFLELEDEDLEAELYDDEDAMNALYTQSLLSCIEVASVLQSVIVQGLSHSHSRMRAIAAAGVVEFAKNSSDDGFAEELKTGLHSLALAAQDSDERSAHVLALGELGISPLEFLEDPSPAVRMCAALAPALSTSPQALALLLEMLEQHAGEIDGWFTVKPLHFTLRPRFSVVQRVAQHIHDFDQLANAAIAVARITSKYCVDAEWGPLLVAAFSDGMGTISRESQRRFLEALTQNAELWDPVFGNATHWFKKAGLPYDRTQCIALSQAASS